MISLGSSKIFTVSGRALLFKDELQNLKFAKSALHSARSILSCTPNATHVDLRNDRMNVFKNQAESINRNWNVGTLGVTCGTVQSRNKLFGHQIPQNKPEIHENRVVAPAFLSEIRRSRIFVPAFVNEIRESRIFAPAFLREVQWMAEPSNERDIQTNGDPPEIGPPPNREPKNDGDSGESDDDDDDEDQDESDERDIEEFSDTEEDESDLEDIALDEDSDLEGDFETDPETDVEEMSDTDEDSASGDDMETDSDMAVDDTGSDSGEGCSESSQQDSGESTSATNSDVD